MQIPIYLSIPELKFTGAEFTRGELILAKFIGARNGTCWSRLYVNGEGNSLVHDLLEH